MIYDMETMVWFTGISLLITFSALLGRILFQIGHVSARLEELERWRIGIRNDLHEISDKIENISLEIKGLHTLIEERTERHRDDKDKI